MVSPLSYSQNKLELEEVCGCLKSPLPEAVEAFQYNKAISLINSLGEEIKEYGDELFGEGSNSQKSSSNAEEMKKIIKLFPNDLDLLVRNCLAKRDEAFNTSDLIRYNNTKYWVNYSAGWAFGSVLMVEAGAIKILGFLGARHIDTKILETGLTLKNIFALSDDTKEIYAKVLFRKECLNEWAK